MLAEGSRYFHCQTPLILIYWIEQKCVTICFLESHSQSIYQKIIWQKKNLHLAGFELTRTGWHSWGTCDGSPGSSCGPRDPCALSHWCPPSSHSQTRILSNSRTQRKCRRTWTYLSPENISCSLSEIMQFYRVWIDYCYWMAVVSQREAIFNFQEIRMKILWPRVFIEV